MIVRKFRLKRSWSQEHLADLTGLSTRTIQRIERGEKPSLESLRLLADVFEMEVATLQKRLTMKDETLLSTDEERAIAHVKDLRGFYSSLIKYLVIVVGLFVLNLIVSPDYMWVYWVMFGWGIGIVMHALAVFEVLPFFSAEWERKQIEKRLGRKL